VPNGRSRSGRTVITKSLALDAMCDPFGAIPIRDVDQEMALFGPLVGEQAPGTPS
jgi:hypothetical protein